MSKSMALPGMQPIEDVIGRPAVTVKPSEARALQLSQELEMAMMGLYQAILASIPGRESRIIQFVATEPNAGCSELTRQFGLVLATRLDHSVLLVDALGRNPAQGGYFKVSSCTPEEAAIYGGADSLIEPVGRLRMEVARFALGADSLAGARHEEWMAKFLAGARENHHFVLIDMPGVSPGSGGPRLLPQVDGIVLVAEAGRTRWQAMRAVQDSLNRQGGRIIGVMLNKLRHAAPHALYETM